jgi:RecB family endonuclease NucS
MAIEMGLWRLGDKPTRIDYSPMDSESRLEQVLAENISIADPNLLLVGRQVPTAFGKFVDLLALDADGNLVMIELKPNC